MSSLSCRRPSFRLRDFSRTSPCARAVGRADNPVVLCRGPGGPRVHHLGTTRAQIAPRHLPNRVVARSPEERHVGQHAVKNFWLDLAKRSLWRLSHRTSRTDRHRAPSPDRDSRLFISEDPIGLAGGINPYTYAANDPVNHKDPTGLIECDASELDGKDGQMLSATCIIVRSGGGWPDGGIISFRPGAPGGVGGGDDPVGPLRRSPTKPATDENKCSAVGGLMPRGGGIAIGGTAEAGNVVTGIFATGSGGWGAFRDEKAG